MRICCAGQAGTAGRRRDESQYCCRIRSAAGLFWPSNIRCMAMTEPALFTGFPDGLETRISPVEVPGHGVLSICSLRDRNQYHDPDGTAARLGISAAWWPLFGLLWPSSLYLAAELAKRPVRDDERVLEIGCGLALPGLVAHQRGMQVTVSDHHPMASLFLRRNLQLNNLPPNLPYRYGHWGPLPEEAETLVQDPWLQGQFDFVLASSLLYEPGMADSLSDFIAKHTAANAEVWVVDTSQSYRGPFKRHMKSDGFEVTDIQCLNQTPCLSGEERYRGRLMKFRR